MPWQAFLLDSNASGYAAALTALASHTNAKQSFTDAQLLRDASHDSTLKVVFANITEAELNGGADLVNLRTANYPTELCRHRWNTLNDFRCTGGFHMLGESVRSTEGESGRSAVHTTRTAGAGDGSGNTLHDSIAYLDLTNFANGTLTVRHGKFWNARTTALNSRNTKGVESGGAATDAASINIRDDAELSPAVFIDGQDISGGGQFPADLGWTSTASLFGANTFAKANLCQPHSSVVLNYPSLMLDVDRADPFANVTAWEDAMLERVDTVGGLSAEMTFYAGGRTSTNPRSGPFGVPDSVLQDDGGAFTDLTTEAGDATTSDVPMLPASPATGDQFIVSHDEPFSCVAADMGQFGAGDYTFLPMYFNGASIVELPDYTWHGTTDSAGFKSAGFAGNDPRLIFNPPDDWTPNSENGEGNRYRIYFRYTAGTVTTQPIANQIWVESTFFVVHLKDNATPDTVIPGDGLGLGIGIRQATAAGQVQLINPSYLGCDDILGSFAGGNNPPTVYRVKGGRLLQGSTAFWGGSCDEFHIGAAEDRTPPWDTSDRPTASSETALAKLVEKGADPDDFTAAAVAKYGHWRYITVGPHPTNTGSGGTPPTLWNMDGVIFDKVGESFKGIDRSGDPDKHCWATRGRLITGTHRRIICRDVHAAMYFYMTADTTNRSPIDANNISLGPLTLDDIAFIGFGTHEDNTAGMFAMRFGGGSGSSTLQDNGQGARDVTFGRIVCKNLSGLTNNALDNNAVVSWNWDQEPTFTASGGFTFIACDRGICGGGGENATVVYVVTEDSINGFVDHTADNYDSTNYEAFTTSATTNDAIYFGFNRWPIGEVTPNIVTSGVGDGLTMVKEYATAEDTWAALSNVSDGTSDFTAATGNRTFTANRETDAVKTDKNGQLPYEVYWIRFRITAGGYSTAPVITSVNGPDGGGYLVIDEANRLEFIDMEGPWMGVRGLAAGYATDGRTVIFDRFTGRLKSGETIAAFGMFFMVTGGPTTPDNTYTLSEVKGGQFDKAFATTNVHEDNVGRIAANVSTTPNEDIEEVA